MENIACEFLPEQQYGKLTITKCQTITSERLPVTGWMSDPRDRRGRGFGSQRHRQSSPRRGWLVDLVVERRTLFLVLLLLVFFAVVALGTSSTVTQEADQTDLEGRVQEAMVRAGLPSVEVQVVDWTVILHGRLASEELKVAATRVAQAESGVVAVENLLVVPTPVVQNLTPEPETPDLPANQADLLLQARLSAAAAHSPIQFESGGDRITENSVTTLDLIANFLINNPETRIQIVGHTDSDGEEGANLTLSRIRAEAVRAQLIARGVTAEQMTPLGMGESDPIDDNITREGKSRNRRIEFLILPEGQEGHSDPTTTSGEISSANSSND